MAQSKYIQSVLDAAKGRPKSTEWYKDKIKEFGKPGAMDLIRDGKRDSRPFYGRLNMFIYDPKFKKTLPYYDTFPLVLPLEKYDDGFLGINLHYLPVRSRAVLMTRLVDNMLQTSSTGEYLDLQYRTLADASRYAEVKPCIKRYLITQIQGQMIQVPPEEWMKTIFLPLENFQKRSRSFVWQQSKRISMGRPYG